MHHKSDQYGGIYVHIPYCVRKCPYCDFYSSVDLASVPQFLDCLAREMEMVGGGDRIYDTLYIGGGTPSVLGPAAIALIIENARRCFRMHSDIETTLEVNPGTVTRETLAKYRQAGINRLNIGIQSFHDKNLEFLGRIHTAAEAGSAIEWARQAGFDNMGIDLIYGLPGQDKPTWLADLNRALEADVAHLACYILTCESETPLGRDVNAGRLTLPQDGLVRELFDTTIEFLTAHGFRQYEISNFARLTADGSGMPCSRHNQKYWSLAPYIGLGPSAHSFLLPERRWNHRAIEKYVQHLKAGRLPIAAKETLTREQMIMEAIYLGLRTTRGIDLDNFGKMFGISFVQVFETAIADLQKDGLLKVTNNGCALTPKGMAYHDSIAALLTSQDFM